jgi:signal transduction histidine kinase
MAGGTLTNSPPFDVPSSGEKTMSDALQKARDLLDEMKRQAQDGTMIPFRVPGQIDAILTLLDQAGDAGAAAAPVEAVQPEGGEPAADDPVALAEKMLTESSEFVSIAVHEMRIPLTSIRGYSDMIAKQILGELNEQQMQFMETIRSNVMRMDRLIADVNDVAKLRAQRLHLDVKMDMAKNVLLMAEKETKELAAARNITLTFEVPEGLPLLNVDGARVGQAIRNLVENAVNYSPEGSTVAVVASNDGGRLRISVTDQGIGMTEEDQAHLGEPFWRSDHEVIRSVKGHGLGYAVAKGLIELMGGEMFVETVFEQGSTFGFTLPGLS